MENIDRYIDITILEEKRRRDEKYRAIHEFILANFQVGRYGVNRHRINVLLAKHLNVVLNNEFTFFVKKALKEIGIHATLVEGHRYFSGIYDEEAKLAWLKRRNKHRIFDKERRARNRAKKLLAAQ